MFHTLMVVCASFVWPIILQVREFDVVDISPFTINFGWERDGAPFVQPIFKKGDTFPSTKQVTLTRGQAFDITASYR